MKIELPHTIQNCKGEKIIFHRIETDSNSDKLIVESFCQPGSGPVMHIHHKQDEGLTVVSGIMGYELVDGEKGFVGPGEQKVFRRGVGHRFWAEGSQPLHCLGWISPVNTIVFFLTSIYAAQNKTGTERPEMFDSAFLLTKYAAEYDLVSMPSFVKRVIIPATYQIGKLMGKYKHFQDAPEPV